jgi:hypothetical protein
MMEVLHCNARRVPIEKSAWCACVPAQFGLYRQCSAEQGPHCCCCQEVQPPGKGLNFKPQISLTAADCLSLLNLLAAHTKLHKRCYSTTVKQMPVVSASTLLTLLGQPLGSGFPIDLKIVYSLRLLPAGVLNAGDTEGGEGNGWGVGHLCPCKWTQIDNWEASEQAEHLRIHTEVV